MAENNQAKMKQNVNSATNEINLGKWINESWDFVMANFTELMIISLIYVIIVLVASSTVVIKFILSGPLSVGIFYVIFNKMRGQSINIGDISKGFNFFVAAVLADILITVFVSIGFFFLIIPGIVISALYMFAFPLILEKNMDFWEAMETSRKVVTKNIFELSVFMLVLYIFMVIGVLLLFVGFLVALPITFAAVALAYKDIFGLEENAAG
ncbi:hypothetical protein H8E88_23230 [candidate division KSB1 bacterium]|nr:hypothetical protein [candidate division KSB1 bacterium]MBL7092942.1 hypothetical protein [candidate division KSB1 bacterium]